MLLIVLTLISALSFLYYGTTFFATKSMKLEFERYGLDRYRQLIGGLQLLGGFGMLVGLFWVPALLLASGGLALLMLIGFGVRLKMKDGFWASLPSFIFMVINFYICLSAAGIIG